MYSKFRHFEMPNNFGRLDVHGVHTRRTVQMHMWTKNDKDSLRQVPG